MSIEESINKLRSELDQLPRQNDGKRTIPQDIKSRAIAIFPSAGVGATEFARLIGINSSLFIKWQQKGKKNAPKFKQITVDKVEPPPPRPIYITAAGGVRVELADLSSVAKLLKLLSQE